MSDLLPIGAYLVSLCFAVWVSTRLKMPFLSPYWIFLLFQSLYNVTPWLLERIDFAPAAFGLLSDRSIIQIQLVWASLANLCFCVVFLFFWRRVRLQLSSKRGSWDYRRRFLYLVFPLFVLTCLLAHFYGWHQYTAAGYEASGTENLGGMFTVTAYTKFLFVSVYLYYIHRFGLDKGAWLLLAEHVVVLIFDGARATFLPVVLLTLFIFTDQQRDKRLLRKVYSLAALGMVASIGVRSLIITGDSLALKLVTPIAIEGGMGDYPALQSIAGIEHSPAPAYTYGVSYILDPLIWVLPQSIRDSNMLAFQRWTESIDSAFLSKFAPMGGFYYLAEAFAAFSYIGALIVTVLFAASLVWFERNKNNHSLLYLGWMPTVGLLFVKTQFGNVVKLFLIQMACLLAMVLLARFKVVIQLKIKRNHPLLTPHARPISQARLQV